MACGSTLMNVMVLQCRKYTFNGYNFEYTQSPLPSSLISNVYRIYRNEDINECLFLQEIIDFKILAAERRVNGKASIVYKSACFKNE